MSNFSRKARVICNHLQLYISYYLSHVADLVNCIVRWRKRWGPMPPNYTIGEQGKLIVPKFTRQYQGEYSCIVTSPLGIYKYPDVRILVKGLYSLYLH